jgi:hypothetical protein
MHACIRTYRGRAGGAGVRNDSGVYVGHAPPWCGTSSGLCCHGCSCSGTSRCQDAEKRCAYNRLAPNRYPLVPFLVETYGRLGKPVVAGDVSKSGSVAMELREISVGLCNGNYLMHRASLEVLAGVAGASARERMGLLRMCVTSGVLCAVGCSPLLNFALCACLHSAVEASGAIVLSPMSFEHTTYTHT